LFVSFGPQPEQYRAYAGAREARPAPGTTGPPTDVVTFYNDTRRKAFRATFSIISALGPLAVFAATIALVALLLSDDAHPTVPTLIDNSETPQLPIEAFCGASGQRGPLVNAIFGGTIHFSATHVALLAACLLAYAVSANCTLNVLGTHRAPRRWRHRKLPRWLLATCVPIVAGSVAFGVAQVLVGNQIGELFGRLFPVVAPASDCGVLRDAIMLRQALDWHMRIGALFVAIAVASLIVAAASLAHRYERNDINGAWSDSYVLRHNLNSLLTLFFIASVLLVVTNVALSAAMDWSSGLLDVVSNATSADKPDVGATKAAAVPAADEARAKASAAAFASIKTLKGSVANFTGGLGSLLLIVMFVPALLASTSEIELAGKCHAYFDMRSPPDPSQSFNVTVEESAQGSLAVAGRVKPEPDAPDPPDRIVVAGWKTVQDWKAKHGLKLSFGDLTGSFIAVLAPLLSSSVIDLTKLAMGSG
jgi:hypothetical protein